MNTKVIPIFPSIPSIRLSKREAQKIINELSRDSSNVRYTDHAKDQMLDRGFSYNNVLTFLRDGFIQDEPENRSGRWCYKIIFHQFNGNRDAGCVVDIKQNSKLKIVTVMWIDL